jgi:predicted chitinase
MITRELFDRIFPTRGHDPHKYNLVRDRDQLIAALNKFLPVYEISTYLRICAFLASCGIETDYFKTSVEYASGDGYDTRTDLGNTKAVDGDGRKYKGRSLVQTTGAYNYLRVVIRFVKKLTGIDYSKDQKKLLIEADRLEVNFIAHPEKLAEVEPAVEAACIFWEEHGLNAYADRREFKQLNGLINRGSAKLLPLQWPKRNELYSKCLRSIQPDFDLLSNKQAPQIQQIVAENPTDTTSVSNEAPASSPDDNFLADAIDKNVSADELRGLAREHSPRLIVQLARPIGYIWAALEAGNVYAWFGIALAVIFIGFELYLHRVKIQKAFQKLKAKLTQ